MIYCITISIVLILALYSGQRTNFLLIPLTMILTFVFVKKIKFYTLIIPFVFILPIFYLIFSNVDSSQIKTGNTFDKQISRYNKLTSISEHKDESVGNRLLEVIDVLKDKRNFVEILLGKGVGAVYKPVLSYPERNITSDGFVHNIHFGPALIFNRYGLIGLGFYIYFLFYFITNLIKASRDTKYVDIKMKKHFVLWVGLINVYMLNFLLRNSMNDPMFSIAFAQALFAIESLKRRKNIMGSETLRACPPPKRFFRLMSTQNN